MSKLKNSMSNSITKVGRQFGVDLFGRVDKYLKPNKSGKPGGNQTSYREPKKSEYAKIVMQKTAIQRFYNITARQLRTLVNKSLKSQVPEEQLIGYLELQLCSIILRSGFARTMRGASQLISHGKVMVNDRYVNIKSYKCKLGDIITLDKEAFNNSHVQKSLKFSQLSSYQADWLDIKDNKITVMQPPCLGNTKHWVEISLSDIINA